MGEIITCSVYQTEAWKNAREISGAKAVEVKEGSSKINAFEKEKKISFFGKKRILFAEGNPKANTDEEGIKILKEFKAKSREYFYGIIYPTVVSKREIFSKAGFWKVINNTVLIDLSKSEEELWQGLEKKSARWGAKFGEKKGLSAVEADSKELIEFYKIYKKTANKGGFEPESKRFVELLGNTEISRLFVVKYKNKVVAGGLVLIDRKNNYSVLNLTGSTEEGLKMQAMPFLYWNIILFSKRENLRHLDLGGYDKEAKTGDKTYQINKFKERFGGEIVEQPIYSTNAIYPILRILLRLKKRFFR